MAEPFILDVAQDLYNRSLAGGATLLVCGECPVHTRSSSAAINLVSIVRLIRHVTTSHGRRVAPIYTELRVEAVSGPALAERLGLPPATDKERRWREDPREKVVEIMQRMVDETRRHNEVLGGLSDELTKLGYEPPKKEQS